MTDYRQLAVACHYGSVSKPDIDAFIQSIVDGEDEYDGRLFEAYTNDLSAAQKKIFEFIEISHPGFQLKADGFLLACRAELRRQIALLLDGKITPVVFCRFFNSMEIDLITDHSFSSDDLGFLGDLYNACDYCDDRWTLQNTPYLAEECTRVSDEIDKAELADKTTP